MKKLYFIYLYTEKLTNFHHLSCSDIIQVYNLFCLTYLTNIDKYIHYLKELTNIIKALFQKVEDKKDNKSKGNNQVSYIVAIFESFCDILVFSIVSLIIHNKEQIINIIQDIITFIPILFKFSKTIKNISKEILFKIVCMLCIMYSYCITCESNLYQKIIGIIQSNNNIIIPHLHEILLCISEDNLFQKFTKESYFSLIISNNYSEKELQEILNLSNLKNYNKYMRNINYLVKSEIKYF